MLQAPDSKCQHKDNYLFTALNSQYLDKAFKAKGIKDVTCKKSTISGLYLIIQLPVSSKTLTLRGELYSVDDNHVSVYQKPGTNKLGFNSVCHYRIDLQNAQGQQYKLYLYLNDLGQLTVSPVLILIENPSKKLQLTQADKTALAITGLDPARDVLNTLQAVSRDAFNQILTKDEILNDRMATMLLRDDPREREACQALVNQRIELLSIAEKFTSRSLPQLVFLKKYSQHLSHAESPMMESKSTHQTVPEVSEEAKTALRQFFAKPMKKKKKKKPATDVPLTSMDLSDNYQSEFKMMLNYIKPTIAQFGRSNSESEKETHFKKLCSLLFDLAPPFYAASQNKSNNAVFENLRLLFIAQARSYFSSLKEARLLDKLPLLEEAGFFPYLNLPESFLVSAIKADDVKLLDIFFKNNTHEIVERSLYEIEGKPMTLIETSLHYDAPNCYEYLCHKGFSPFNFTDLDSPIIAQMESLTKTMRFAKANLHAYFDKKTTTGFIESQAMYDRIIRMTTDPDEQVYTRAQQKLAERQYTFLIQCRRYGQEKRVGHQGLGQARSLFSMSLPCLDKVRPSVERLKTLSRIITVMINFLKYVKPSQLFSLSGAQGNPLAELAKKAPARPDIALDDDTKLAIQSHIAKALHLTSELLESALLLYKDGVVQSIEGPFHFKPKNSKQARKKCNAFNQLFQNKQAQIGQALHRVVMMIQCEEIVHDFAKVKLAFQTYQETQSGIIQALAAHDQRTPGLDQKLTQTHQAMQLPLAGVGISSEEDLKSINIDLASGKIVTTKQPEKLEVEVRKQIIAKIARQAAAQRKFENESEKQLAKDNVELKETLKNSKDSLTADENLLSQRDRILAEIDRQIAAKGRGVEFRARLVRALLPQDPSSPIIGPVDREGSPRLG